MGDPLSWRVDLLYRLGTPNTSQSLTSKDKTSPQYSILDTSDNDSTALKLGHRGNRHESREDSKLTTLLARPGTINRVSRYNAKSSHDKTGGLSITLSSQSQSQSQHPPPCEKKASTIHPRRNAYSRRKPRSLRSTMIPNQCRRDPCKAVHAVRCVGAEVKTPRKLTDQGKKEDVATAP